MNVNTPVARSLKRTKIRSSETMVNMIAENIRDTKRLNLIFKQLDKEKKQREEFYDTKLTDIQAELDFKIKRASVNMSEIQVPKISMLAEHEKKEERAKESKEKKRDPRVSVTPFSKICIYDEEEY